MKVNIQILIVVVFFVSTVSGQGQVLSTGFGDTGIYLMATTNLNKSQAELRYESIDGSPYLTEDFRKCDIYLKNGSAYRDVAVRLNIYDNNLEFQRDDTYYIFDKVDGLKKIEFADGQEVIFLENKNKELEGFYRVDAGHKFRLLTSYDVNFREGKSAINSYSEDVEPQFIRAKDKLYIQKPDGKLVYIKNKKSFANEFGSEQKEFVNYAKKNKLNPSDEDDLIKIVEYMDSTVK